jgi:hypothetical protein
MQAGSLRYLANKKAARFPGRPKPKKKATGVSALLLLLGGDFLHSLFRGGFLSGNFLNGLFGFGHGMWMFWFWYLRPERIPGRLAHYAPRSDSISERLRIASVQ